MPIELPDRTNRSKDLEAIVALSWFIPLFRKEGFVSAWDSKTGGAVQIETKTGKAAAVLAIAATSARPKRDSVTADAINLIRINTHRRFVDLDSA